MKRSIHRTFRLGNCLATFVEHTGELKHKRLELGLSSFFMKFEVRCNEGPNSIIVVLTFLLMSFDAWLPDDCLLMPQDDYGHNLDSELAYLLWK